MFVERQPPVSVTRYLLPYGEPPTIESMASEGDDVWFQTSMWQFRGLGRIKLSGSEATLTHYLLPLDSKRDFIGLEEGKYVHRSQFKMIGQSIAVHEGCAWYGEISGPTSTSRRSPESHARQLALCCLDPRSKRITKYSSRLPDDALGIPMSCRLELAIDGTKAWVASSMDHAWIFDIASKRLETLVVERERSFMKEPKHRFQDIALESNGKRGWLLDATGALYVFDLDEKSLLRYAVSSSRVHLDSIDIGADGKVWFTSVSDRSGFAGIPALDLWYPPLELGYVHSFDANTNELMTYKVPNQLHPRGILARKKGAIWFCFGAGIQHDTGIGKLDLEKALGSKTEVLPEKLEDWRIADSELSTADEEAPEPDTFQILPDQPNRWESSEYRLSSHNAFCLYTGISPHTFIKDIAEDSQGGIWFTTWRSGYIGVLKHRDTTTDCVSATVATNNSIQTTHETAFIGASKERFGFIFRYGIMARSEVNTFLAQYTKDMISDPPIITRLSLTEEEMERIHRKMIEIDFFSYPARFSIPDITGSVTPYNSYYFLVEHNSEFKELWWEDGFTAEYQRAEKLRELIRLIKRLVESKDEYRKLPDPRGLYI